MLGVARNATGGSTYHYPAGGELPAVSSRPTATGTHTSGVARREDALRGGRGDRTQESRSQSVSKKGGRGYPWYLGQEWNPEAILGCEEATAMAPEAAPRGPPQDSPRPRSPR